MRFMPRRFPRFRAPRMGWCMALAAVLLVGVAHLAPQNIPVILYKGSLLTLATVIGYLVSRWVFPYGRPDKWLAGDLAATMAHDVMRKVAELCPWMATGAMDIGPGTVMLVAMTVACVSMICRALLMLGAMLAVGLGL